jgi:pyruvate,water dikinase
VAIQREDVAMQIVWLEEPECGIVGLVGGKTANLSRLAAAYPVPLGFCLTTLAAQQAQETSPRPGEAGSPPLPEALAAALAAAYRTLADRTGSAEPCVAVRSSAVDEDGQDVSFAGQHDTFLNVSGLDAVAAAVRRCWQSAGTERALDYRRQHGLQVGGVQLAVLVQQLIAADVAAVVFSNNPVTGRSDEVVINASWGLGESIVGGTVTPDTYVVAKEDFMVRSRCIGEKQRMTVPVAGGTREVDVPRLLRAMPALDDAQAAAMARLACSLEEAMGWPVDIECAYRERQLFLLQCRPITTLLMSSGGSFEGR